MRSKFLRGCREAERPALAFELTWSRTQVLAYPCGKFLEKVLPAKKYKTFGYEWSLNPGPFTMKGESDSFCPTTDPDAAFQNTSSSPSPPMSLLEVLWASVSVRKATQ